MTRRKGEIVRVLDRGIGYVDLERLSIDQVNEMFEKLRGTSAIIFDLRGYPQGTIGSIAPRINKKNRIAMELLFLILITSQKGARPRNTDATDLLMPFQQYGLFVSQYLTGNLSAKTKMSRN